MSKINNIFGSYSGLVWTPSELDSQVFWYDADDLTTITKDGSNFVSDWDDKFLNYNLQQLIPSLQSTYFSSGFGTNSKPYLNFGLGKYFTIISDAIIQLQTKTIVLISTPHATTNFQGSFDKWIGGGGGYTLFSGSNATLGQQSVLSGLDFIVNSLNVNNTPNITIIKINGSSSFVEVNGVRTTGTLAISPTNTQTLYIGNGDGVSTLSLNVDIAEFIMYNNAKNDTDVALLDNYANTKYGIY